LSTPTAPRIAVAWPASQVRAIQPCVSRWNDDNTMTMLRCGEVDFGCKEPSWLVMPQFNPRYTPFRSPNIRLHGTFVVDASLHKETSINVQFRAEVFNLMNSFFVVAQQFNNNAENVNFGSLFKAQMSAPNSNYPRQFQLGLKLVW